VKFPSLRSPIGRIKSSDEQLTLTEHLAELRVRIIRAALAVATGMIIIVVWYDPVLRFLRRPYDNLCEARTDIATTCSLYSLGPLDAFGTRFRIAMWGGIVLALPVVMWQIWRFVVPALHAKEKKYAIPFILSAVAMFALGGFLAYWTLEKALEFLITWSGEDVIATYQVGKYVSLVTLMIVMFGVGFQLPVLLVFLQLVGVLKPRMLIKFWRYAIMIIFVIAAVITPSGDPISMLVLAVPLCILYFIAALIAWLIIRRRPAPSDG
jgi:sec-independent protein translocase protein TatC